MSLKNYCSLMSFMGKSDPIVGNAIRKLKDNEIVMIYSTILSSL